jgi:hypothetical protein
MTLHTCMRGPHVTGAFIAACNLSPAPCTPALTELLGDVAFTLSTALDYLVRPTLSQIVRSHTQPASCMPLSQRTLALHYLHQRDNLHACWQHTDCVESALGGIHCARPRRRVVTCCLQRLGLGSPGQYPWRRTFWRQRAQGPQIWSP